MLRVTIELVPHGIEDQAVVLGQAVISNTGQGTAREGEYLYQLSDTNSLGEEFAAGSVSGYPRKLPGKNAWDLIYWVLRDAVGYRNGR